MQLLNREQLTTSLESESNDSIFLEPLLDRRQVGAVSIDLRLGYDFLVSILTRKPFIQLQCDLGEDRSIASYFQETRRELGDTFILYPNQVALTTTLEHLCLPHNVYADVLSRSSYTRLGIHVNTMIQPGFRGCVPLELFNHGNNAIELIVGSRICQARFFTIDAQESYLSSESVRKYYGDVRPTVSKASHDEDLEILSRVPPPI